MRAGFAIGLAFVVAFAGWHAPQVSAEFSQVSGPRSASTQPPRLDTGGSSESARRTESASPGPADADQRTASPPVVLLVSYCVLIVMASLAGGWLPSCIRLTHTRMQTMLSLVGGMMLGIGMFHMLPHAVSAMGAGSLDRAIWWMMLGMLTMFFLLRTFHFHQHTVAEVEPAADESLHAQTHGHAHAHGHAHGHAHAHGAHHLSWIGVACGLSLHTLIDGLALGASVQAELGHGAWAGLFGFGTFLAIVLHKPLDAVSITSLMAGGGWSPAWRTLVNAGFALMCPLGAAMFVLGIGRFADAQPTIVGCALAFSAGVFVCISLGDLLPEMEFHSHNRLRLTAALLVGTAAAYGIRYLEPAHVHAHDVATPAAAGHSASGQSDSDQSDSDHTGHDHSHQHE
ncbi:MAG: ZIP family metal transporter [Planctomycetaceae bacterium]